MNEDTEFVRFLDAGVSPEHVAREITIKLQENGSKELEPGSRTRFGSGANVHMRAGGAVVALRPGSSEPGDTGLLIGAAHTDSPGLQIKHRAARIVDGLLQVPIEVYGAPIVATWLDRELELVGRIIVRDESGTSSLLTIRSRKPFGIVANLAIHLNRTVNENLNYNRQDHLKVIVPISPARIGKDVSGLDAFRYLVGEIAGVDADAIVDMELNVVPYQGAAVFGPEDAELIVSPRIDNLAGCYSVLEGFRRASRGARGSVAIFFDHEEIGSATNYGAAGDLTRHALVRLLESVYGPGIDLDRILETSLLVSNDGAHARHPNYAAKHDEGYAPVLGGGPVVKKSAIRRYASELSGVARFTEACERVDVAVQYLQNRSDIPAGSTIGPAVSSRLAVSSVDVGIPMLAMHSARETAARADIGSMIRVFEALYGGE